MIGLAILLVAGLAYVFARQSSAFAIRRIEVAGAPAPVQAQVRAALASTLGASLLALHGDAIVRKVEDLPTVVSVSYDRSFPHTLRLTVVPEKATAVLRRGRQSWLVSARGRVMAPEQQRADPALPRIWIPTSTQVALGDLLADEHGGAAARALALAARFPARIATASFAHGELLFRLRSHLELRLGEPTDVRLKLAIAGRALSLLPPGATYLDVSVPERPVAGQQSAVQDTAGQTTAGQTSPSPNPQVSG